MSTPSLGPRILVALDFDSAAATLALVDRLDPSLCRLKVGKELFTACGPSLVETLIARGFDVFLDLKFHDIPNTCAKAVRSAAELGVWMVNVHASGGRRMMEAARESLENFTQRPRLIGVTVLTSMEQSDLKEIGLDIEPQTQVIRLAKLVQSAGLDGVVCSAREAQLLRGQLGADFDLVTPGIRPANSAADDQRRILTPAQAIAQGSTYLVVGRPITQSQDPIAALVEINAQIH